MDITDTIFDILAQKGSVQTRDVVASSRLSRASVHLALKALVDSGKLVMLGKANQARYVLANAESIQKSLSQNTTFHRVFVNEGLEEDIVFKTIERETSILKDIPKNVRDIMYYAFTEMLNNAIEHSQSPSVIVTMKKVGNLLTFEIADRGVGIFNNIMTRRGLHDMNEAIETLLKGKQTTDPARHSGEGIFFTSRVADNFIIKSSNKKLLFDNSIPDVFLQKSRVEVGTKVNFAISRNSARTTSEIFNAFTDESYAFTKTQIRVDLHKGGNGCISRSQARRIVNRLDQFREIVLDFKGVETVGQGFADEIFRVWLGNHPGVIIRTENANENVQFMINHAKSTTFR